MKVFLFICLTTLSFFSFADKIIIKGDPILLEERDNVYYPPVNYTPTTSYTYVNVSGVNRVCYLKPQPALAHLDRMLLNVEVQGTTTVWNCYAIDKTYFDIIP